jgi:hypothetical protein
MATRIEDVAGLAPSITEQERPVIGHAPLTPGDKALIAKPLLGVLYDTPADKASIFFTCSPKMCLPWSQSTGSRLSPPAGWNGQHLRPFM